MAGPLSATGGRMPLTAHSSADVSPRRAARSLLVLRPDNLGDVVLFSGTFRHLRALYPAAEITVCVKRYALNLLEHCPYIDRVVVWEDLLHPLPAAFRFRGRQQVENVLKKLRCMLSRQFDAVLVPVRSPTREMHQLTGAFRSIERIGIAGDPCNCLPGNDILSAAVYTSRMELFPGRELDQELEVNRDFLRFLGADVVVKEVWPEFWTDAADRRWATNHVGSSSGVITLGIAPGVTSAPKTQYPAERLVQAIADLHGCPIGVVVFGGPAEIPACKETAKLLAGAAGVQSVRNLAGQSTVRQLVEGLRQCDLVLAEDTAALHIATALRKPTVGILGGGHFGRFYPWGDHDTSRVVNRPMDCYGCNWKCRYETVRCVQEIAPEQITRELQHLLSALQLAQ